MHEQPHGDNTLAQYLAQALPGYGVTHVFELVGGMITVLLDALHQNPALRVISMHHEQGAGFAAEGFARMARAPSVALATSGPGATNLLTAIGSCYFDSVPAVFITGQVNTFEMRKEGLGRQGGFQETDIVSMATPVTKWATVVESATDFGEVLDRAFSIATGDRPGPVLIDIPMNVQRERVTPYLMPPAVATPTPADLSPFIEALDAGLAQSSRPLALIGGGVRIAGATDKLLRALEEWQVPAVVSLMGLDAVPCDNAWRVGFLGSYGNRWANWAVSQADLLLVLGSRLDIRQTGSDIAGFVGDRRMFHVDVDASELNSHVVGATIACADAEVFLSEALARIAQGRPRSQWLADIRHHRQQWPHDAENVPADGINPNHAIVQISEAIGDAAAFVTDVGQHQMWAAQSVYLRQGQRFLTSGGMGSMGFGLPAAIGAALAAPGRTVCLIAGDGGFQCNIQELQTAVRLQLPLRIVILDNGAHGMVRQFQQSYLGQRYHSTVWGYSAPDFAAVADSYGIASWTAGTHDDLHTALSLAEEVSGPSLIRVVIEQGLNAYPKMAFGQPFGSMEPNVAPLEMEGT